MSKQGLAIITGGASGMGAATAKNLADAGFDVAILDKNSEDAHALAASLGGNAFECDVSSEQSAAEAIEQCAQLGPIRVCVNCAGIAPAKRMVGRDGAMPLAQFQQVIDVNLLGTFNIMRLAAEQMLKNDIEGDDGHRGVIINTASIAAYEGQIGQTAYSASKGGIVSMTLPAARELAKFGVRVNTVAPGLIATPLLLGMPDEVQTALAERVPYPKRLGQPEEFAALVRHIIENHLINGEVIRLDGALRMQAT